MQFSPTPLEEPRWDRTVKVVVSPATVTVSRPSTDRATEHDSHEGNGDTPMDRPLNPIVGCLSMEAGEPTQQAEHAGVGEEVLEKTAYVEEGASVLGAETLVPDAASEDERDVPMITTTIPAYAIPPISVPSNQKNTDVDTNTTEVPPFAMGDHVYRLTGPFGLSQHHAIVLTVARNETSPLEWILEIADFDALLGAQSDLDQNEMRQTDCTSTPQHAGTVEAMSQSPHTAELENADAENLESVDNHETPQKIDVALTSQYVREYRTSDSTVTWHKVQYHARWLRRHFGRSGTCTAAAADAPGMVRARVDFLLHHPEALPPYHMLQANTECVAVWCRTGTWATLQATSWLAVTAAGQAKSAATLATVAASTTVTVPAAGLWGWMGYTSQASLAVTQPHLLPAIAAYGAVTVGLPLLFLQKAKQKWKDVTVQLNTAFWDWAQSSEDFVESLLQWSSQHDPVVLVD
jgi:hypothetical protein